MKDTKRRGIIVFVLFFIFVVFNNLYAITNVILVGWDGASRDHVKKLLEEGKLPNLKNLVDQGSLIDIDVVTGATDTKAGWTQILTGYKPEVTGVFSNSKFRDVPAGLSIFERLKSHFGQDFVCVAVIGKKSHCGEIEPPFEKPFEGQRLEENIDQPGAGKRRYSIVEKEGKKYLSFPGSPYYTMHKVCNEWHYGLKEDVNVGNKTLELLEKYSSKQFFFFVHFAEVDHTGHNKGEDSKEYDEAIVSGDTQLGRIIEKLKGLSVYERTIIYVTADHGFDKAQKSHKNAPYVFLGTNDRNVKNSVKGKREDIAPTILNAFGIDVKAITPPLDGIPLNGGITQ